MRTAFFQPWPSLYRPGLRRIAVMALVWALHVLLLLLLLRLAPPAAPPPAKPPVPIMIELMPEAPVARAAPARRKQDDLAHQAGAAPIAPVPPAKPAEPTSSSIWSQIIPMTRAQLATADLAAMPSRPTAQAGDSTGASSAGNGEDSADTAGLGEGPDGQPLYEAQWHRKPTHAELNFYMPPGTAQTGWGMIACQTIPDNRVENCHEIGQSPGSGLASAVRQAAWQFRVRPPRIGGRPMIGAWVRIRIEYTVNGPK